MRRGFAAISASGRGQAGCPLKDRLTDGGLQAGGVSELTLYGTLKRRSHSWREDPEGHRKSNLTGSLADKAHGQRQRDTEGRGCAAQELSTSLP
jgi:hypothetical protein